MKCVNKSSKEFKQLQNLTGMGSHTVATLIGRWQSANNSDDFPSYNELLGIAPGSLSLYNQNQEFALHGSDIEFGQYVATTGDSSLEGFKNSQATRNANAEVNLSTHTTPTSLNTRVNGMFKEDTVNTKPLRDAKDEALKKSILNGKDFNNVTVGDILKGAISQHSEYMSETGTIIINRANKMKDIANIPVRFIAHDDLLASGSEAYWDSTDGVIYTSKESLGAMDRFKAARVFLHELAHVKTAKALLEPTTAEDFELSSSIRTFMDNYEGLSESYGFTNEMEFAAELYSNPEFKEEVYDLYNKSKKARGLINKILDAIRRLFNLKKPNSLDKIMESIVFNVEISEAREVDGQHGLFHMKRSDKDTAYKSYLQNLKSIEKKVLDAMLKQKRIDLRNASNNDQEQIIIDEADKAIDQLMTADNFNKAKITVAFATDLINKARSLELTLTNARASLDNPTVVGSVFDRAKAVLELLEIVDDVQSLINDFDEKFLTSTGKLSPKAAHLKLEEVHEAFKEASIAISHVAGARKYVESKLKSTVNEAAVALMSDASFTSEVTFKYTRKFEQEYANDPTLVGKYTTASEYVSARFKAQHEEIKEARQDFVYDMITTAYKDMGIDQLNFMNPLNAETKLTQMAASLVLNMRDNAIKMFRPINNRLQNIFNEYNKNVDNSLNQRKKFEKMLKRGYNDRHYLINKYSQEIYDGYLQAKDAIRDRMASSHKAFAISSTERINSNDYGIQYLYRDGSSINAKSGDILNLQVDGKSSFSNAKVSEVTTLGPFSTMTSDMKNTLANSLGFTNYQALLDSKLYELESSRGSKLNPSIYNLIHKGGTLDILGYVKESVYNEQGLEFEPEMIAYYNKYFQELKYDDKGAVVGSNLRKPKDEYINREFENMSKSEKAAINEFMAISRKSDDSFVSRGNDALVKAVPHTSVNFFAYPYHNVDTQELRAEGRFKTMAKEYKDSLKNTRNEDIDQGAAFNSKGELIYATKPHYRNHIDPDKVSFSMFDVYAREAEQMVNIKQRTANKTQMELLIHISETKDYLRPYQNTIAKNIYNKFSPELHIKGDRTNEYAKLKGMLETHFHDIASHNDTMFFGLQATKVVGMLNGMAASTALTFNAASGVANILNGMTQIHIDAAVRKTFTLNDLVKAEAEYTKDLPNIMLDIANPHKISRVNQIMQKYNVMGGLSLQDQEYIKNKIFNKYASTGMLNVFNETGEHMMNAVLTMAILQSIKVMNKNHSLIDKNGNIVNDEKNAASLLDMLQINKTTGLLEEHASVEYTTHTPEMTIRSGGNAQISMLVKKRVSDLFGDYDNAMQGEAMKSWWGKTLMMFKRFFPPGMTHRFRGYSTVYKHPLELTDSDRIYNIGLRDYEEGYYVTTARMLIQGAKSLKNFQLNFIPQYYNSLSKIEQSNIQRTAIEMTMIYVILPAMVALIQALAGDDDDDEYKYFVLYQISRLNAELAQFHNISALMKMFSNPVAGFRFIQNFWNFGENLLWVPGWFDEDNQGNNQFLKSIAKILPGVARLYVNYSNMFNAKQF